MATKKDLGHMTSAAPDLTPKDDPPFVPFSAPPPPPVPPAAPARGGLVVMPPRINFTVWAKVSGIRPDQTAGFQQFARSKKLKERTAVEWAAAYREFLTRPV